MNYLYTTAIEEKLKKLGLPVIKAPVSEFYQRYQESIESGKPLTFPAISFWYTFDINLYDRQSLRDTVEHRIMSDKTRLDIYTAPLNLEVSIELWTVSDPIKGTQGDVDRDDLLAEMLYYLQVFPNIYVDYKGEKKQFALFPYNVTDNSDISKADSKGGRMYRTTIDLKIDNARFFYTNETHYLHNIETELEII